LAISPVFVVQKFIENGGLATISSIEAFLEKLSINALLSANYTGFVLNV
jgi:hypothetical protein